MALVLGMPDRTTSSVLPYQLKATGNNKQQQAITMYPWLVISCLNDTSAKSPQGEILDYSGSSDTMFHDISAYILDHPLILLIIHHSQLIMCYVSDCDLYIFVSCDNQKHPPLSPQSGRTAMTHLLPLRTASTIHGGILLLRGRINERRMWE